MKKWLLPLFLSFLFLAAGCTAVPQEDPEEVLDRYYRLVQVEKFSAAYDLLSELTRQEISREDYIRAYELQGEMDSLLLAELEKVREDREKKLEGRTYHYVAEFKVTETLKLHTEKEREVLMDPYTRYMVSENGQWKVFRGDEDLKGLLGDILIELAYHLITGEVLEKDLIRGESLLKEALEEPEHGEAYYWLGYLSLEQGSYEKVLDYVEDYLKGELEGVDQGDAWVLTGSAYEGLGNMEEARKAYEEALAADPGNQYAAERLQSLVP